MLDLFASEWLEAAGEILHEFAKRGVGRKGTNGDIARNKNTRV